tara:strand:+ start:489 stop:659 length:171 start_codon:yes stop_codon:yes gene_type:complete
MNSDKTNPPPIIQNLEGDKGRNDYIERKWTLFKGIEKILQNEENRLIQNDTIKNSN